MTSAQTATIRAEPDEMHVIRRLGRAVIKRWTQLPSDIQVLLVEQATFMADEETRAHVHDEIVALIARHQPRPLPYV